jgi:uncharacterized protein (DUF302 family)
MRGFVIGVVCSVLALPAVAAEGMARVESEHSVPETAERLVDALEEAGLTIMAQVDHAANADSVDMSLRPTQVVIFGNPAAGTPLMQCSQSIAIDLPQKALIWEDADGAVWLGYNDPDYLRERHAITGCEEQLSGVEQALAKFAQAATGE